MPKYKEKLIKLFNENPSELGLYSFGYGGICGFMMDGYGANDNTCSQLITNHNVSVEKVSEDEGGEYSYDVYAIYKFTETEGWGSNKKTHEYFFKFYGHYTSHEGSEYLGWKEVQPTTKTVQVFE